MNQFVIKIGNSASRFDGLASEMTEQVDEEDLKVRLATSPQTETLYAYDKDARILVFIDGYIVSDMASNVGQIIESYCASPERTLDIPGGIYNLIVINLNQATVDVYNDGMGLFPFYFFYQEHTLVLTNSLFLLKQVHKLEVSSQGFGETYTLGWTIGEKTVFRQLFRTLPGTHYHFSIRDHIEITKSRLSENWSNITSDNAQDVMSKLHFYWQQAVERYAHSFAPPYGLMLSGGLDSRLVLGELMKHGEIIACTHGNPESGEYKIASQVAQSCGAEWLPNPMDEAFQFTSLELDEVHKNAELLLNPIWYSSQALLFQRGVSTIATGCLGDALLGGSYYLTPSKRNRFLINFALSLGLPISLKMTGEEGRNILYQTFYAIAAKRLEGYGFLLNPAYQQMCREALENLKAEFDTITERYLEEGIASGWQMFERFQCEHRHRKLVFGQSLSIRANGEPLLPTTDRDFLAYVTSIEPRAKFDHHLYYQFIRRYYPSLARIPIPNLHGPVDVPQFVIEARRAARRIYSSVTGIRSKHNWVNFSSWILHRDYLAQYKNYFLEHDEVFDAQNVNRYFELVKDGSRSVYDGNETLGFLNTAMLLTSSWEMVIS